MIRTGRDASQQRDLELRQPEKPAPEAGRTQPGLVTPGQSRYLEDSDHNPSHPTRKPEPKSARAQADTWAGSRRVGVAGGGAGQDAAAARGSLPWIGAPGRCGSAGRAVSAAPRVGAGPRTAAPTTPLKPAGSRGAGQGPMRDCALAVWDRLHLLDRREWGGGAAGRIQVLRSIGNSEIKNAGAWTWGGGRLGDGGRTNGGRMGRRSDA